MINANFINLSYFKEKNIDYKAYSIVCIANIIVIMN